MFPLMSLARCTHAQLAVQHWGLSLGCTICTPLVALDGVLIALASMSRLAAELSCFAVSCLVL